MKADSRRSGPSATTYFSPIPNAAETRRALASLELVDRPGPLPERTRPESSAHVFLPACSSFEKDGTFMNAERRIQRVRKAIEPVGQARLRWDIICALAKAMGRPERLRVRPAPRRSGTRCVRYARGAGMTYARLDVAGLQWPCPSEDHPGTIRASRAGFRARATGQLQCIELAAARGGAERPSIRSAGDGPVTFTSSMPGR